MPFQMENGGPGSFLNPLTVCSSFNRKFVLCPFADEETNGRYPFVNGLNGLNGPAVCVLGSILCIECSWPFFILGSLNILWVVTAIKRQSNTE